MYSQNFFNDLFFSDLVIFRVFRQMLVVFFSDLVILSVFSNLMISLLKKLIN